MCYTSLLQVNVFELGRFVSFFTRRLHIKLPPTDPCIFVMRFASELQFGEKEHDVSAIGLKGTEKVTGRRHRCEWEGAAVAASTSSPITFGVDWQSFFCLVLRQPVFIR